MTNWNPESIPVVTDEFHREFLRKAYDFGWQYSEDPFTKVGALIVDPRNNKIISYGTNRFPPGLNPTDVELDDRNWKLEHIIHAEPSAVFSAVRRGASTSGATIYMPWVPCVGCAMVIADAGIKTLIGHKSMILRTPERWHESVTKGIEALKRAGVEHFMYDGEIGVVKNLLDKKEWCP